MQLEPNPSSPTRRALLGLAAALPVAALAQKASMPDVGGTKPYKVLRNPVANDKLRVREFISYACPACQRYHAGIAQWAESLPRTLSFVVNPVILNASSQAEITLMSARVALGKLAPGTMAKFDADALELMQAKGNSPSLADIEGVVSRYGDAGKALVVMRQKQTLAQIEHWLDAAGRYEVLKTPSLGVLGQFVVTPEDAAARAELFFGLLNGLISQSIKA